MSGRRRDGPPGCALCPPRNLSTIRQTHRPPLTIEWVRNNVPYQTPELMELFIEGLRKAGLDG